MEENILTPGDYLAILNRRKWALIVPFVLIVAASVVTALMLPSIYKSQATILIEQREIPAEYVTSSMTTYAEQRMQSIKQRVLTSQQLQNLIRQFSLYQKQLEKITIDEIVAEMRKQIVLTPVNVEVADRSSGRSATATIAFTLSYEGENPEKVQQVVNTIITLFLKEDLKVRTDQASSTHEFLREEAEKIKAKLAEYEKEMAIFKKKHANSLPELFQVNMQTLNNIERNIELVKENLRTLREKKGGMEEELVNTPVDLESVMVQRGQKDQDESRLEALKMELINLKTKFSDLYPDVKKIKQEIQELSAKVEQKNKEAEKTKQVDKNSVKNPAFVTLSSRLAGLNSDISSLNNQIDDLEQQAVVCREKIAATPGVEEKYNAILSERNTLYTKYNEMQAKMMEAKVAQGLESEQKGERFTLIESAILPEKPFKPNRLAIVLIGIVLGLGAGVGFASIVEFSDTSFRDAESLTRATGFPVLTVVPCIVTRQDRMRRIMVRSAGFATAVVVLGVSVFLFDHYVMDLDVVWAKIMRRIS
ncbi:MAG: chain-length determining protein [Deltaproteobacteria bacterium]|uniref:GumC family protein n=1 Tax=Desulfobacula sp. TaxID=2593537 RepID=UPI0019C30696|nr:chain-length determining protein [Candidatus Desulfobacula maris]MBL6992392.1 chain-length determining protein [Desulfobacula sp.]